MESAVSIFIFIGSHVTVVMPEKNDKIHLHLWIFIFAGAQKE
jgi:hypothetical protein